MRLKKRSTRFLWRYTHGENAKTALAVRFGWNIGPYFAVCCRHPNGIGIVSFVRKQRAAFFDTLHEIFSLRAVSNLTVRQAKIDRTAFCIYNCAVSAREVAPERPMPTIAGIHFFLWLRAGEHEHRCYRSSRCRQHRPQRLPWAADPTHRSHTPARRKPNEPVVAGCCNTIALWDFRPRRASAEAPQDPVENHTIINPWNATRFARQQRCNDRPFPFCEFITAICHPRPPVQEGFESLIHSNK